MKKKQFGFIARCRNTDEKIQKKYLAKTKDLYLVFAYWRKFLTEFLEMLFDGLQDRTVIVYVCTVTCGNARSRARVNSNDFSVDFAVHLG